MFLEFMKLSESPIAYQGLAGCQDVQSP